MEDNRKDYEPDDPMLLRPAAVDGDQGFMLDSIIEEYAMMGWDEHKIGMLFDNPYFVMTHGLKQRFGTDEIRRRIKEIAGRTSAIRFKEDENLSGLAGGSKDV